MISWQKEKKKKEEKKVGSSLREDFSRFLNSENKGLPRIKVLLDVTDDDTLIPGGCRCFRGDQRGGR